MKKYKETFITKSQFSDGLRTFPKGTIFESTGVFCGSETLFCVYYPDGVPYDCLHDGNSAQIMLFNRTPITLKVIVIGMLKIMILINILYQNHL